jgi:hypothetical protein
MLGQQKILYKFLSGEKWSKRERNLRVMLSHVFIQAKVTFKAKETYVSIGC